MSTHRILTGTAGVYYVMSELAYHNYHAAATQGNAPDFDILVCNREGGNSAAIQVKSTRWARRNGGRLDFPFSYKAGIINRPTVLFAFVDFGVTGSREKADIYLVPSSKTHDWCKSWIHDFDGKMVRYQVDASSIDEFKNSWKALDSIGIVPERELEKAETETPPHSSEELPPSAE